MIVVFIGPPGSGKGTYAQMLAKKGWVHFSMGQALRDHIKRKGPLAQKIDSFLSRGIFVPDSVFFPIFEEFAQKNKNKNIVFDGLPRNLNQARGMLTKLKSTHPIDAYFFIDVSEKEIRDRLSKRRQCEDCGKVFGKTIKPKKKGVCDRCGGKLVIRSDDKPSVIHQRFRAYRKQTEPVIEWATNHYPVFYIHGHGSPSVVLKRIEGIISVLKKGE